VPVGTPLAELLAAAETATRDYCHERAAESERRGRGTGGWR